MFLYLVIFSNGHEEKLYCNSWKQFLEHLEPFVLRFGLPDLVYRKE